MWHRKWKTILSISVVGLLIGSVGCNGSEIPAHLDSSDAITELPPLVTTSSVSTEALDTSVTETTVAQAQEMEEMPLYHSVVREWTLPETLEELYQIRVQKERVYLLGAYHEEETQKVQSVLYYAQVGDTPEFVPLFDQADESDFMGLTDFTVLSDGTICGLLCTNAEEVPYEDPNFHPDTFDWESYYENYMTQYQLVWYNERGQIAKKLGLSTVVTLDESDRQTMAFTGVQCDSEDNLYLTATIHEEDCLMALDATGNLRPIQGKSSQQLPLSSYYQWGRCAKGGMLLLEKDTDEAYHLYHVVITDEALWKTEMETTALLSEQTILANTEPSNIWLSFWDAVGIYQIADPDDMPQLLYQFKEMHLDAEDVAGVYVLPDDSMILTLYNAQGGLSLEYIVPEAEEVEPEETMEPEETKGSTEGKDHFMDTQPPVIATPVNFS